ncbi:MAG: 3-deoxy-7-phosphoheptulonate synthase [Bacilli bacterium]|nr:3-deoxy-7-phosphoheptulonate synthase [Bacilli bacterium]
MYEKVKQFKGPLVFPDQQFTIIAGPCAVEDEEKLVELALFLKSHGITHLRAGAYKPRTSPYTFQGLEAKGLAILQRVKARTGIKIVTEIMDVNQIQTYVDNIDIIQVGARNMQNFALLKELGKIQKPILLKRGFGSTIEEWLYACEYLMNEGNDQIILCERGIKTFEPMTRNTLDISSVPIVKGITNLNVFVDPSHSSGRSDIVRPLARAAVAVGADGLMIEVHHNPALSLSDKDETIDFNEFVTLLKEVRTLATVMGKQIK